MGPEATSEPAWSAPADALGPYLNAVRRHWRLVLCVTVLAVLIAGTTLVRSGQSYSATASILVTPLPEGDAGFVGIGTVVDSGDPARAVQTAAALVDTPDAAARAAQSLGKGWTAGQVSAAVAVAPLGASNVLAVTATAPTAAQAQRVATAYARSAIAYRAGVVQSQIAASINQLQARLDQLGAAGAGSAQAAALASGLEQLRSIQGTGREPTLSLSQTAGAATANGASKALILLLALLGGFAVGSVAALALETFSRPVRDREEITSLFPVPVLAALPVVPGANRSHGGGALGHSAPCLRTDPHAARSAVAVGDQAGHHGDERRGGGRQDDGGRGAGRRILGGRPHRHGDGPGPAQAPPRRTARRRLRQRRHSAPDGRRCP